MGSFGWGKATEKKKKKNENLGEMGWDSNAEEVIFGYGYITIKFRYFILILSRAGVLH